MIIIHGMKTLPRLVGAALSERIRVMPAVVVTGARQTGKSTLVVRALRNDPNIEVIVAGRRIVSVAGADDESGVLIDIDGARFAQAVKDLSPGLIIHCVGPFLRRHGGQVRTRCTPAHRGILGETGKNPIPQPRQRPSAVGA